MTGRRKIKQSRGWGAHFLRRLDQSEQWAPDAWWRPRRDELFSWKLMWSLFSFNFLFFLLPIGLLGGILSKLWEQSGGDPFISLTEGSTWAPFVGTVLTVSILADFYACNSLRVAWNRRVRKMEWDTRDLANELAA